MINTDDTNKLRSIDYCIGEEYVEGCQTLQKINAIESNETGNHRNKKVPKSKKEACSNQLSL